MGLSAERLVSMIKIQGIALTLLVACAIAADPCDSTAPPEPGPAPSPTPTPTNPCGTTPSPSPAPTPAPTPGCDDKPADWKSTAGSTCADYVSKAWCTSDGSYGSGWDKSTDGSFDDGGDGSDGANGHTYNGRDCRSDDAANADGRARSFCNARGGRRVRHSVDANRALSDVIM